MPSYFSYGTLRYGTSDLALLYVASSVCSKKIAKSYGLLRKLLPFTVDLLKVPFCKSR